MCGERRHATVDRALRYLGIGTSAIHAVPCDRVGRVEAGALARELRALGPGPTIVIGQAGTYNVQFSIQASNSGTSVDNMTVWFRINGTDVANSAGISAIPSSHGGVPGALIFGWNDFFKFATNDYFEIYWTTDNGNSSVTTYPAGVSPVHPASPGIILTVNQVLA